MSAAAIPPFAYGHDGALLITSDGPELLVHDGDTEAPLWKHALEATVVGVGVTDAAVVAVAAEGTLVACDRKSGAVLRTIALERLAVALAAAKGGVVAVLGASSVNVVRVAGDEQRLEIDVPGATAVALDADGTRVAVGTRSGAVRVFDTESGAERGSVQAPSAIAAITWSPRGYWIASIGKGLVRVRAGGRDLTVLFETKELAISGLACSAEGALLAMRIGPTKVGLFDLVDLRFQGIIAYERTVGGLAFGRGAWLGIGLDLGDANKVDLLTGMVHRSDPHPGRTRNSWVLVADPKCEQIAELLKRAAAGPYPSEREREPAPLAPAAQPQQTNVWALLAVILMAIGILARLLNR
jgi:WD40 repeat protein